ncbi:MAG TPA: hypothetical protein VG324_11840 [Blastocatellia bacterium]|nr:hypothetical protein [Blastocatellia bacterium]
MNAQTVKIQVAPRVAAILDILQKRAEAQRVSLDTLLLPLVPLNGEADERPFYETATTEEWLKAFNEWVESHDPNTPVILDDSREVIYED